MAKIMKTFKTINELAMHIINVMEDRKKCQSEISNIFLNVTHGDGPFGKFISIDNIKLRLIPTLPETQLYSCRFNIDDYSETRTMYIDIFDNENNIYCDIKFNSFFKNYKLEYSEALIEIMKDTGKTIYEFDEEDWNIVKFKGALLK